MDLFVARRQAHLEVSRPASSGHGARMSGALRSRVHQVDLDLSGEEPTGEAGATVGDRAGRARGHSAVVNRGAPLPSRDQAGSRTAAPWRDAPAGPFSAPLGRYKKAPERAPTPRRDL